MEKTSPLYPCQLPACPQLLRDPSSMVPHPSCTGVLLPLRPLMAFCSNRLTLPPQPADRDCPEANPKHQPLPPCHLTQLWDKG